MDQFSIFFASGWHHIITPGAFDHWLFLAAMLAMHTLKEWKRLLLLVTAFTLGHTITLGWTGFVGVLLPGSIVEFLIPLTILLSSGLNLLSGKHEADLKAMRWRYTLAAIFGLIHGMGFAGDLVPIFERITRRLDTTVGAQSRPGVGPDTSRFLYLGPCFFIPSNFPRQTA